MILYILAGTSLTTCILVGNLMTIIAFCLRPVLRKNPSYWYITSLAVADFMVGLSVPTIMYNELSDKQLSRQTCDSILAFHLLSVTPTFGHLLTISLDRYFKLISPLKYMKIMTLKKAGLTITGLWLISGVTVLLFVLPSHDFGVKCLVVTGFVSREAPPYHIWLFFVVFIYVPFGLLLFCSLRVYLIASRLKKAVQSAQDMQETGVQLRYHLGKLVPDPKSSVQKAENNNPATDSAVIVCMRTDTESVKGKRLYQWLKTAVKQRKVAILITCIVTTTGVCWIGASTAYVMTWFCPACGVRGSWLQILHPWLLFLNSALNPILLLLMSDDFRKAYKCITGPITVRFCCFEKTFGPPSTVFPLPISHLKASGTKI